jgi:hypothetical protein
VIKWLKGSLKDDLQMIDKPSETSLGVFIGFWAIVLSVWWLLNRIATSNNTDQNEGFDIYHG